MRLLTNEGGLRQFLRRNGWKIEKMRDWELYYGSCKNNADKLKATNPDIVQILNDKFRKEKERDRIRKEKIKEDGGEWLYNGENGEYYWNGEGEPKSDNDNFEYEAFTEEELKEIRKQEELQNEEICKARQEELNEKRRQAALEKRVMMNTPLDPLPERDLCDYEKIRENNINEREEAMSKSGFFEDLIAYKKKIGLQKEQPQALTRFRS